MTKKGLLSSPGSGIIEYVSRGGAVWSARLAHNQEVGGSNPPPATKKLLNRHVLTNMSIFCRE